MFFFLFIFLQIPFGNVTDNQEAIDGLREKFAKRQAKEERKRKAQEKKISDGKKGKKPVKRKRTVEGEEELDEEERKRRAQEKKTKKPVKRRSVEEEEEMDEEEEEQVEVRLDDSSEYSDEVEDEDLTAEHYPFAEKAPEVRNFTFLLPKFLTL